MSKSPRLRVYPGRYTHPADRDPSAPGVTLFIGHAYKYLPPGNLSKLLVKLQTILDAQGRGEYWPEPGPIRWA